MRLTRYHKEAFVNAVMQDVPKIDYRAQVEKLVRDVELKQAEKISPQLAFMLKDNTLRGFIDRRNYVTFDGGYACGISNFPMFAQFQKTKELETAAGKIVEKAQKQYEEREAMTANLTAAIGACATLKVAKERLPEFAKYLPEEEEKSGGLPAITNLVADLSKMGWKGAVAA
jgi:hypothetical protein